LQNGAGASTEISPDAAAVAGEVMRIAASPSFRKADQCVRLLRYLTSSALEGRGSELKEYTLGVAVFGRPDSFDPHTDAVVRLEARRLRLKLAEYYQQEGLDDPVIIDLPKGAYVPRFRARLAPPQPVAPQPVAPQNGAVPVAAAKPAFRRWTIVVTAAVVVLATVLALWLRIGRASVQPPRRPSIAVLRVRNLSKTSTEAWLQTALQEMLTSELAAGGKLRTIPAEDVVRWQADLGPAGDGESLAAVLRLAQNNLGADTFIVGSYVVTGACPQCRVRVDLGVLQARTGERLGTVIDEGSASDLLDLTTRLGRELRAEIGVKADVPPRQGRPGAGAMPEYAEGLAALRRGDPLAARGHLESAVSADPQNPLIHSAMAQAWTALGYDTRARDEDRRAFDLAASLDRLDRLGMEARYRASVQQWDRAIEIYRTIFKLFPDSLDDGLNLAQAQWRAGRVADATSTLNELRRLPKPDGNDPRIDLTEARAVGSLGDFARIAALAHRAAQEAQARGARYLFARARLLEGGAMQNLGDSNYAAVQAEARQTCEAIGDRSCLSSAWRVRGNDLYYAGDFKSAQQAYERGVAIARELGNRAELANMLAGFAVVAQANRNWPQAEKNLQEAIALNIEIGYNPNGERNSLADLYIDMGRFSDAGKVIGLEAGSVQQSGAHEDLGYMLLMQATLARLEGRLADAEQLAERALTEQRRTKSPLGLSLALAGLSSVRIAAGNLPQAEKNLAEAGPGTGPEDQGDLALARAELRIAQGQFMNAAQEAEKAATLFDKVQRDDLAVRAFTTAADAFDMSNRAADALAACREGGKRAALTPNETAHASAQICSWRLSELSKPIPSELQASIQKLHNPELRLNLEYARALRAQRLNAPGYRELCSQLAGEARKLGYVTLSLRAAALEK
jgi:tetratricopeptide (TPR) repeat protein